MYVAVAPVFNVSVGAPPVSVTAWLNVTLIEISLPALYVPFAVVDVTSTIVAASLSVNSAPTFVSAVTSNVHGPVPLHALPVQPTNFESVAAAAVNVTDVPSSSCAEHAVPQSIP